MGRRILSSAFTMDVSEQGTAPVAPIGALRMRPKSDGTTLQLSFNGGAYFDMGSGAASGSVRLDQVLDPDMPAPPASTQIKTFSMSNHQLAFVFSGGEAEECFVIVSTEPVTPGAAGALLLLRAAGATTEKNPLRIETRGVFAFTVAADGKVAIGAETGLVHRLNVYHTNTGGANVGAIHGLVTLAAGNTAVSMTGSELTTSDAGNTTALLAMKNLELNLQRESSAIANGFLVSTVVSANAEINIFTGTVRGLTIGIGAHNAATVSTWEAIRITAPSTFGGGIVETKRAIITEAGAGYTGLGTLTPTVQLHVVGAMHDEQTTGQVFTIAKTHNTETAQLDFRRTQATGLYLTNGDLAGRMMFYGWFSPAWKALGYVQTTFNTDYASPAGLITMGAGDFGNARVEVLQTDAATGGVTLYGAALTPWFAVNATGHLFSHGTTGSMYYRNAAGYFVNLDIDFDPTGGTDVGKVLTVTDVSGTLYPRWITPSGSPGSGTPSLPVSTLQYNNAGAFGAVSDSLVSGAAVTLGGALTIRNGASSTDQNILLDAVSANPTRLIFTDYRDAATGSQITWERGRLSGGVHTDLTTNNVVARFLWKGQIPTTGLTQLAFMHGYYTTDYGSSAGVLELGAGGFTLARIFILQGTGVGSNGGVTIYGAAATPYFQVDSAGFKFSSGTNGSLYFKHSTGYFNATASPSSADSIPYWDNSEGVVAYMTIGTGLSITGTAPNQVLTSTATGGTPGGATYDIQYRTAVPNFGGITQTSGGLLMGTSGAPPFFTTTFAALRYTFTPSSTLASLNVGQLGTVGTGNPSSPVNGDIYYNSVAGKFRGYQNLAWIEFGASAAGSSTELQYRNSSTGALAAMLGSVVDTSGNLTMSGTPTFSGGFTITKSNVGVIQYLRLYESTAANSPQISVVRTRGTEGTNTAVAAGDALFSMPIFGAYGHASNRQGGELRFDTTGAFTSTSAPTVFRLKTTHLNAISPNERLVLGGAKSLLVGGVDNTLVDLFTVTFNTTDHVAGGGEIHMVFVAKQLSGSIQTHVYRRKMTFIFGHNGATNTSMFNVRQETAAQASAASDGGGGGGFSAINHSINADAAVGIDTAIPANPNVIATNVITYKILANSTLTTFSQFTIYYHIIYHGEADIVLA